MLRKSLLLGLLATTIGASGRWEYEGRAWWKNVEYLASDQMEGRSVGTRGFDLAANYVAEQYERTGLKTTGDNGYFQEVWLSQTRLVSARLRLWHHNRQFEIRLPDEAQIHFNAHTAHEIKAHVVFVGYGLRIPEAGYDDLRRLPLKGAIVAYLTGAPNEIAGNLRSHYTSAEMRWKAYRAEGAVGMIAIPNPRIPDVSWSRQTAQWAAPQLALMDPELDRFKGLAFSATWNPALTSDLLAGSGHSFSEIMAAADSRIPLPHFILDRSLRAEVAVTTKLLASKNVVAIQPGTDPSLKDEYVVISAHLDHLGVGKPVHGDGIFNGAMDDASGVSSVIEIAKMLREVRTRRSMVFLALTGEEAGELGSQYFAKHPPLQGRIVADLNMDMFLPLFPLKWLEVQGLDESSLGDDIAAVADAAGVKVQADKEPDQNRFIRSDQYSFVKAGVPAVAFKFGYQKGDPEERVFQHWYNSRYHAVTDDSDQPVDLKAAAQFNDILKDLLLRVADADEAPKWRDESLFKRLATPGL